MNALTVQPQYHANLPDFLRVPDLFSLTDQAIGGIGGSLPPYISIKASKWRLVGADGEEQIVDQTRLEVIVLGGNEHVSKTYYDGPYDPAGGNAVPPTCSSDNGRAPSSTAMSPQSPLCASCKWNAWGSKVSEVTGKDLKACADSKKLAVVLAKDTQVLVNNVPGVAKAMGQIFLLRVPAASMRGWRDFAKDIRGRGVPIIGCVVTMSFDPNASYPALMFSTREFVTQGIFTRAQPMLGSAAVREAVGADDVPFGGTTTALPAETPAYLQQQANAIASTHQPTHQVAVSTPAQGQAAPPAATATESIGTTRGRPRGRPPAGSGAAQAPVAQQVAPVQQQAAPVVDMFAPQGQQAAQQPVQNGAIQTAQAASPDLDALLGSFFDKQ